MMGMACPHKSWKGCPDLAPRFNGSVIFANEVRVTRNVVLPPGGVTVLVALRDIRGRGTDVSFDA